MVKMFWFLCLVLNMVSCGSSQSSLVNSTHGLSSKSARLTSAMNCPTGCLEGQVCDHLYHQGGQPSCATSCSTPGTQGNCPTGFICSPISGACESECISNDQCAFLFNNSSATCSTCPTATTCTGQAGYCQLGCSAGDFVCTNFDPSLTCVAAPTISGSSNICFSGAGCTQNSQCPSGQQCIDAACQYQTCTVATLTNCAAGYQASCTGGYCMPTVCNGQICATNEICPVATCMCGTGPSCGATGSCVGSGNSATCKCGSGPACTNTGETCVDNACKCGVNPGCGAGGSCNASTGMCTCNGTPCTTVGDTCVNGQCKAAELCGTSSCVGMCVDDICVPTGGDGSQCSQPPCFSGQSLTSCGENGAYCMPSETCSSGVCNCGSAPCLAGQICSAGQCIQAGCGDGFVQLPAETCDEGNGAQTGANYGSSGCPNGWHYDTGKQYCVPNILGAGNGMNGRCATDCSTQCILMNGTSSTWPVASIPTAVSPTSFTKMPSVSGVSGTTCPQNTPTQAFPCIDGTGAYNPACSAGGYSVYGSVCGINSACNSSLLCPLGFSCQNAECVLATWSNNAQGPTANQCPNGLGIWVSNTEQTNDWQSATYPAIKATISITQPVAIYGGFPQSAINNPAQRLDFLGNPLGQTSFSQTVLGNPTAGTGYPIFEIGTGTTTTNANNIVALIDGFQIIGGQGTSLQATDTCLTATKCTGPTTQAACNAQLGCTWNGTVCSFNAVSSGGITVCQNSLAILQNLRISNNTTTQSGGAIRNFGTMILKDSFLSSNAASTQGGAISSEGSSAVATVERVRFVNNGFPSVTYVTPSCAPGGVCPTGMTCPANGGLCTGTPKPTCISGGSCPLGMTCPTGGGPCTNAPTFVDAKGGAIAATGDGALNIYASKFNANYAYTNGGAVYSDSVLNVVSSLFVNNWASNAGGGIYLSAKNNKAATLNSLTVIDNKAYTLGGGGIYDEGAGSSITNSLFRNNVGLYEVTNASLSEWLGSRDDGNFPQNQVNSISDVASITTSSMTVTPNASAMTKTNVDMCPMMAYTAQAGSCSGTSETCGTAPALPQSCYAGTGGAACTFSNVCGISGEFVDCTAPLYAYCAPQTDKYITGKQVSGLPYSKDIAGNANIGAWEGAYQGCTQSSQCTAANVDTCNTATGNCVCGTSQTAAVCSGTTPICSNGSCIGCSGGCTTTSANQCLNNQCVCGGDTGDACHGSSPICSGTGTSAKCVQCNTLSQCPGNGSSSDTCTAAGECQCDGAAACSGSASYCVNHQCSACPNNCQTSSTNQCDPGTGQCTCGGSVACSGSKPYCVNNRCVACTSNSQCQSSGTNTCSNGSCICAGTSGACSGSTPICSATGCVECSPTQMAGCNSQTTNTCSAAGQCVCGGGTTTCSGGTPYCVSCNASTQATCTAISGCEWNTSTTSCVLKSPTAQNSYCSSCLSNAQCLTGASDTCSTTTGSCVCGASGTAPCSNPNPRCKLGACTLCSQNSDCPATLPVCSSGHCQPCTGTGACSMGTVSGKCSSGQCVQCLSNTDCSGSTPICYSGACIAASGIQCQPATGPSITCQGTTPACVNGACAPCTLNSQCPASAPICVTSGNKGTCNPTCSSHNDCITAHSGTPVCASGQCVQCASNTDCDSFAPATTCYSGICVSW